MSRAFFYRLSLAAPIAVPLAALALLPLLGVFVALPALILGFSLGYTRWTYPVFAIVVLLATRRWSVSRLEHASSWLPVAYAPWCGIEMATFYGRPVFALLWWSDFAAGTVLALLFGYAYVGGVRLLAELVSRDAQSPTLPAVTPPSHQVPNAR